MKLADTDDVSSTRARRPVLIGALSSPARKAATRWVPALGDRAGSVPAWRRAIPPPSRARGRRRHRAHGQDLQPDGRSAEAMVEGQKQLLAAVSHELRTPLTRMRLVVEMLGDQGRPEARRIDGARHRRDRQAHGTLESTRPSAAGGCWRRRRRSSPPSSRAPPTGSGARRAQARRRGAAITRPTQRVALGRVFKNLFTNRALHAGRRDLLGARDEGREGHPRRGRG